MNDGMVKPTERDESPKHSSGSSNHAGWATFSSYSYAHLCFSIELIVLFDDQR